MFGITYTTHNFIIGTLDDSLCNVRWVAYLICEASPLLQKMLTK